MFFLNSTIFAGNDFNIYSTKNLEKDKHLSQKYNYLYAKISQKLRRVQHEWQCKTNKSSLNSNPIYFIEFKQMSLNPEQTKILWLRKKLICKFIENWTTIHWLSTKKRRLGGRGVLMISYKARGGSAWPIKHLLSAWPIKHLLSAWPVLHLLSTWPIICLL